MAMKIANAKIENATFGFMYTNSVLCAKLKIATMENGYLSHHELSFDFRNPEDVLRLAELMRITEVSEKEFTEISLNFLEENFRGSHMSKD